MLEKWTVEDAEKLMEQPQPKELMPLGDEFTESDP
jgi:hypothetical protein